MNFSGKTAVVTGAGRGLGLSYARELAKLGANVVISDSGADKMGDGTDDSVVLDAAHTLQAQGYNVIGHHGDLAGEQVCQQLIETAIDAFGQLDIVIHNAGWVGYQSIEEAQSTFIERALDINIYSPIWLCKHAWKYLRRSEAARVVLTSSDHGRRRRWHSGQRRIAGGQDPHVGREWRAGQFETSMGYTRRDFSGF